MGVDNVNDVSPRVQYVAAAAQTAFDYTFPIFTDADLIVEVDGVTYDPLTDYTVTGEGNDAGGTVTLTTGLAGGEIVTLYRDIPIERTTDFQQNGPLASASFNDELDKLVMIAQQLENAVGRAVRVPQSAEINNGQMLLSPPADWKGKYLYFSATTGVPEPATAVTGTALSQSTIGALLHPRTAAEIAASVTPTDYNYLPGDVRRYGAVGDGSTDDTTALQNALNSGERVIKGYPPHTYLVSYVGTKTINGTAHRYCLLLPDNVTFDLNRSTLKLAASSNAALLLNSTAGTTQNTDISVINGWLDGNQANQTAPAAGEMACIFLHDVVRARVHNLTATNVRNYAGRFLKCDYGTFTDLLCTDSDGDGWSFGTGANSQWVRYSYIDNVRAKSCLGTYGSLVGNPVIMTLRHCNVGSVYGEHCAAGLKIQDDSQDVNIDQVVVIGQTNGSVNSGFKVQGNGAGLQPERIKVGSVNANNCYGNGLFINDALSVEIEQYHGVTNGTGAGATGSDKHCFQVNVPTGGIVIIGRVSSASPAAQNGRVQGAGVCKIDTFHGANGTGPALSYTGSGELYVDDLRATDSGTTMTYAFYATDGKGRIRSVVTNKAHDTSQSRVRVGGALYGWDVNAIRLGSTDNLEGVVQLTNAATSTSVTCGHVWREYVAAASNYFHPIIHVIPWDASARALSGNFTVAVTDGSSGTGFTINHPTAGAADYVLWKVLGWKVVSLAQA